MFKLKKMKCRKCGKERLKTDSGICVICDPKVIQGKQLKEIIVKHFGGKEIESKTGRKDENQWMAKNE